MSDRVETTAAAAPVLVTLLSPGNNTFVGSLVKLVFSGAITDLEVTVNDSPFHPDQQNGVYILDLSNVQPNTKLAITVSFTNPAGDRQDETVVVWKPRHDLGGMGATVVRANGQVDGVFFKFWLPNVKDVYVRGSFNGWTDVDAMAQLGDSGYWFCYSKEARPGDDYRYFVYGKDDAFSEVSDPAARQTKKTSYNGPDAQDANAVIVDPWAFNWKHDGDYRAERRDHRRMSIYEAHWGTFLREGVGLPSETFVTGSGEAQRRQSVRTKLEHIKRLGFTALELLPIHEANGDSDGGYNASFLFAVETSYGTPDDLRMLVDEAHGLGLAVIFDAEINHLTADLKHSSFSQKFIRGWYVEENAPWSNHNQWGGSDWGPDPKYTRSEIRNLLTDCVLMYVNEYHVDGIRFDATTTIPREALKGMVERLRNDVSSASTFLIAEHLTDDPLPYVVGDIGFHAGWYKPGFDTAMNGVLKPLRRGNLDSIRRVFETDYIGEPSTAIKYPLGSHDEVWRNNEGAQTAASRLGGSADRFARMKMRLGWALAACCLGTPMMFMGTECLPDITWDANAGYGTMVWRPAVGTDSANFQEMVRAINGLRNRYAALRGANIDAKLVHWDDNNGVLAYKRWDQNGGVFLIVINVSDNNWGRREYQVNTDTPNSVWHECFNTQFVDFGGWTGACNSDSSFWPRADGRGLLQGVNVPLWSLLVFKQQL